METMLNEIVVKGSGVTWDHRDNVVKQKSKFITDYCAENGIEFKALKDWHVRLSNELIVVDLFLASHTYHFVRHQYKLVEESELNGTRGQIVDLNAFLQTHF